MSCNFCEIVNGYVDEESFRTLLLKLSAAIEEDIKDVKSAVNNVENAVSTKIQPSTTLAMIDTQIDNSTITFLRTYIKDAQGNITSYKDTSLDGTTPYTTTGTVDVFPGA